MSEPVLKSGIAWLAEFSRERRRARAKHGPTVYHRAADTYEFSLNDAKTPVWVMACRPGWTRTIVAEKYRGKPARSIEYHNPKYNWLLRLQGYRCFICMRPFTKTFGKADYPNKEHVMPRSLGGGDEANILMAHARCNAEKKNRMPTACELLYRDFIYEARPNGKSIQF